ncbi:MAG: hypothetical protein ACT4O0_17825 [Pseudonocardia sp.]|jgi:methyl-accepting chemotaxis protein
MTIPDAPPTSGRTLPLVWAAALAFALASLVGIVALTSNLATTDALLTDAVAQVAKIDATTERGLSANEALPPTAAALRDSAPAVLATVTSLRQANQSLTTLSDRLRALAEVLHDAAGPLARTLTTVGDTERAVDRTRDPTSNTAKTLHDIDRQVVDLAPALDETVTRSRSIEAKLRILGLLPGS